MEFKTNVKGKMYKKIYTRFPKGPTCSVDLEAIDYKFVAPKS